MHPRDRRYGEAPVRHVQRGRNQQRGDRSASPRCDDRRDFYGFEKRRDSQQYRDRGNRRTSSTQNYQRDLSPKSTSPNRDRRQRPSGTIYNGNAGNDRDQDLNSIDMFPDISTVPPMRTWRFKVIACLDLASNVQLQHLQDTFSTCQGYVSSSLNTNPDIPEAHGYVIFSSVGWAALASLRYQGYCLCGKVLRLEPTNFCPEPQTITSTGNGSTDATRDTAVRYNKVDAAVQVSPDVLATPIMGTIQDLPSSAASATTINPPMLSANQFPATTLHTKPSLSLVYCQDVDPCTKEADLDKMFDQYHSFVASTVIPLGRAVPIWAACLTFLDAQDAVDAREVYSGQIVGGKALNLSLWADVPRGTRLHSKNVIRTSHVDGKGRPSLNMGVRDMLNCIGTTYGTWAEDFFLQMELFAAQFPHDTVPDRYQRVFREGLEALLKALGDWTKYKPCFTALQHLEDPLCETGMRIRNALVTVYEDFKELEREASLFGCQTGVYPDLGQILESETDLAEVRHFICHKRESGSLHAVVDHSTMLSCIQNDLAYWSDKVLLAKNELASCVDRANARLEKNGRF